MHAPTRVDCRLRSAGVALACVLLLASCGGGDDAARTATGTATSIPEAGAVRADAEALDTPMIFMMLGPLMERARDIDPDLWRRYLGLVLDGLRPESATPLPRPALHPDQLDGVMRKPR